MLSLIKHTINITIADDSKNEGCDAHCGVDWASAKAIALATKQIKDRFGDRIEIELHYLDLAEPVTDPRALELNQAIEKENLPFPILIIDGKPRISGQFDIRMLLDSIDAEIEIKL